MKVIEFNNVGKQYRLGQVTTDTFGHDINRWWAMHVLGKEDPYLKVGEVNVRSQKGHEDFIWALKDISFSVEQGELLGILGKNGAGKSTLLKLLSRITSPTVGEINIRGRIASLLEVGTGFHEEMTGRENIYMNGAILGMTKAEITSKLDEIIDFSGCERFIDTPVKRYSSGMRVRLGFSVAAHLDPEILVVDEVLSVGDTEFRRKAIGKMQDVSQGEGRTILFVSHNLTAIRALCKTGIVLRDGMLDYTGTIDDAINHYEGQKSAEKKVETLFIKDRVRECSKYLTIDDIQINNTSSTSSSLSQGQEVLDVLIKGSSLVPLKCDIKLRISLPDGTPMACYNEGRYKGNLVHIQPGEFTITRRIRLPKYMANGDYLVDLYLHEPNVQGFFQARNCQSLHIEGFHDQFARSLDLSDGFIGLESVDQ